MLEDDLPRQAVAVGMQARAGQADDLVARADVAAVEDVLPLDDPDAEPGQVVFALLVEVGQDRRLAAQQRALGLDAAVADPLDDRGWSVRDRRGSSRRNRGRSSGSAPAHRQSLTDMATRSMPTVACRPVAKASLSLVPTPSVEATSTGSR